jgi:hypothetical protein
VWGRSADRASRRSVRGRGNSLGTDERAGLLAGVISYRAGHDDLIPPLRGALTEPAVHFGQLPEQFLIGCSRGARMFGNGPESATPDGTNVRRLPAGGESHAVARVAGPGDIRRQMPVVIGNGRHFIR